MIKRYDYFDGFTCSYMGEDPDGDYVEYVDHVAEVARLTSHISIVQIQLEEERARRMKIEYEHSLKEE